MMEFVNSALKKNLHSDWMMIKTFRNSEAFIIHLCFLATAKYKFGLFYGGQFIFVSHRQQKGIRRIYLE